MYVYIIYIYFVYIICIPDDFFRPLSQGSGSGRGSTDFLVNLVSTSYPTVRSSQTVAVCTSGPVLLEGKEEATIHV